MQVACIAHFQHAPLSQLAPAMMCSAQGEDMARLIEAVPEAQFPVLRQQVLRHSQTEVAALSLSLKHAHMHSAQPLAPSLISIVALYHIKPVLPECMHYTLLRLHRGLWHQQATC